MLASPSIQPALFSPNAVASPENSAYGADPVAGFETLLAAMAAPAPAAPPTAPVAALPPGGNTLPVRVAAVPTTLEFALESPRNLVQAVPVDTPKLQVQLGTVLPRALVSTALSRIASRQADTAAQPVATLPSGEHSDAPVASEAATSLIAGPLALAATNPDIGPAVAAPIEQALPPQAQAPAATGPHRSPEAKPAKPGLIQPLAQHPTRAFPASAIPVASPPMVPDDAAPIQTTPVPARPAFSVQGTAPRVTKAPGLIRAAARANPAAGSTPVPLASLELVLRPLVDQAKGMASTAPLIARRGPALNLAHQPAAVVTDLRIDPSPRAASPATQITLDPALLRPLPASDAIAQLTALPAEPLPAISAYIGPARSSTASVQPLDFAALIDRIESAREAGGTAPVNFSLRHEDFGTVGLRFETDAGRISVDLSSTDPDFARAVAAAQPAAGDAPRYDNTRSDSGRSDNPRGDADARGQESATGNPREGGGTSRGSGDERGNRFAERRRPHTTAKTAPDQSDLFA